MKPALSSRNWFMPGLGVKRWIVLVILGVILLTAGLTFSVLGLYARQAPQLPYLPLGLIALLLLAGVASISIAVFGLSRAILAPYRVNQPGAVLDVVYDHSRRGRGPRIVAIGGGTGLPATLRALKPYTSNLTAVVTVADDGGSSGRLRKELGVLPPGDLRNNIAALADDEKLMTRLFQHRFTGGALGGHAFGNLFISALAGVTGSLESALIEAGRVLNIQGQVFPATLDDVELTAEIRLNGQLITVRGESRITAANGHIEQVALQPPAAAGFTGSVEAIRAAEMVIVGPGSLYTSILPNLLVREIAQALRTTSALKVYVCNIATQPGETTGYNVAEHVEAIERVLGENVLHVIVANSSFQTENAGENTFYVTPVPDDHPLRQRYRLISTDLVEYERPWRHDPAKLAAVLLSLHEARHAPVSPATEQDIVLQ
ncbi:MAG: YvcK family protein [Anaerolineae bacterium]|nr:YvcK family protein [Anaerolineae bacterium]